MQAGRTRRTTHRVSTYLLDPGANQSPGIPLRAKWITLSTSESVHVMNQRALARSVDLTIYRMRPLFYSDPSFSGR
jgi:hypothetical protein